MNKLIEQFIVNWGTGGVWVCFLMLVIFYILKKEPSKFFAQINEQRSKNIDQAKNLLECEKLSKESNQLIQEYIENYAFKKYYYGINANKKMRDALRKFYQKHQADIEWYELKRAYPYIRRKGSRIKVKLTRRDRLSRISTIVISWFIGMYSLLVFTVAVLYKSKNIQDFFSFTLMAFVLFVAALFYSTINWPYQSAIKIKKLSTPDTQD